MAGLNGTGRGHAWETVFNDLLAHISSPDDKLAYLKLIGDVELVGLLKALPQMNEEHAGLYVSLVGLGRVP